MGSRYGGLKQLDPMGPNGETIMDYSVRYAVESGYGGVVFVIRRSMEEDFAKLILPRYADKIPVRYVFQELDMLPAGFRVNPERKKPYGTAHAILVAKDAIREPFTVINADDFYGRDAMAKLGAFLSRQSEGLHFAMVGYRLDLTRSEHGSVARGVCEVAPDGTLKGVTEMTKLVRAGDVAENREDEANPVKVPLDARVSMNCWGFSAGLFAELESRFPVWLAKRGAEMKSEWYIPFVVDELIKEGKADCKVLPTDSSWFGVTYREDKPFVESEIRKLVDAGEYPANLLAK